MNPMRLYSLRRLMLVILSALLLSVTVPLLAQTTPTPTPSATGTPESAPAATTLAPPTPVVEPVVPLATAPAATAPPPTTDDTSRLATFLLGGLFLLAALAITGLLLLLRRRRPPPAPPAVAPAAARPIASLPPPTGAGTMTTVAAYVYLELEGNKPQIFPIQETPFTIGRDPGNSLPIDETIHGWQTVSRQHALISRHERGYVIEDLGSHNGVRVNGSLTPKNLLRHGWQVTIGGVTFRFVDETQTN